MFCRYLESLQRARRGLSGLLRQSSFPQDTGYGVWRLQFCNYKSVKSAAARCYIIQILNSISCFCPVCSSRWPAACVLHGALDTVTAVTILGLVQYCLSTSVGTRITAMMLGLEAARDLLNHAPSYSNILRVFQRPHHPTLDLNTSRTPRSVLRRASERVLQHLIDVLCTLCRPPLCLEAWWVLNKYRNSPIMTLTS